MSRAHSLFAESLAASSTLETEETFLGQLEQLERRNNAMKKNAQVKDRVKNIDACIQKCRQLMGVDDPGAALLYVKCLSLLEETEKILNGGRISAMSNTNTQVSSLNRIQPIEMQHFQPTPNIAASTAGSQTKSTGFWTPAISTQKPKILNGKIEEEDDRYQYNYYGYHKSKWWAILCMNSAKEAKEKDSDVRDLWNTQIEFFLSCLGFIVGVGNTLRFPSMMYQYGGVFFVPYLICLAIFGLPLVYMHLCIGQYSGLSASGAFWKMMPAASGIGWALVLLAVPVAIYYNIIVAWSLYYLWYSLQGVFLDDGLPWSYCKTEWFVNTRFNCCQLSPGTLHSQNFSECFSQEHAMTAPEAFFHYQVLNRTLIPNFEFGDIQMHMVLSLGVAWVFVFFGVFKGIGSIGWAVSITATIPYLMLIVLLLRALSLKGAADGIYYFLKPDFRELWSINIWRSAAVQVFYELGIDAGPLISMASFSRYRNNIYRDAVLLVLVDMFTSILCGLVIFSFIGFLANAQGNPIDKILTHDSLYLSFTVYPGVTSFMEWGFFWAAMFFGMLMLSAIDAEFAWLEMIASAIMNQLGSKNKSVETRLLIGLCVFCFLCGIPLCARGGIFIFHSIENLNANWNSFSLSLMQVIVVCFIYGVDNFMDDIGEMLRVEKPDTLLSMPGKSRWDIFFRRLKHFFGPTGGYIKFSWCVFAPFILMTLLLASIFNYERVEFNGVDLPWSYEAVAWVVMIGPLFVVPFTVFYTIYEAVKRDKPLLSVVSGKNWRNKKVEPEQQHKIDNESEYMYIDPISRGASAKSRNANVVEHDPINEDTYTQANDRIREWAARSSRTEPLRSFDLPSIVTTDHDENYEVDGEEEDEYKEELYGRRTGRLVDLAKNPPIQSPSSGSESDDEQFDEVEPESERRSTVKKSPLHKSAALASVDEPPLQLFGPPPVQQPPDVFAQSMSRINKKREQRRSDKHRNRVFNDNFHLIVMDPPSGSSASNSADRLPSPAVPDRPDITDRRRRIGPRKSTESGTNISLSPFNIAPSTSTESASGDKESHPFPMSLTIPKLKRPKPIGSIPGTSFNKEGDN